LQLSERAQHFVAWKIRLIQQGTEMLQPKSDLVYRTAGQPLGQQGCRCLGYRTGITRKSRLQHATIGNPQLKKQIISARSILTSGRMGGTR